MRWFGGVFSRYTVFERKKCEERSRQQFDRAGNDPARTGADHSDPPCAL